jgi:glucose-6-phosphate isomerase
MTGLRIHFANCLSDRVGEHGLPTAALDGARDRLMALTGQLNRDKGTGWQRWRSLPFDPLRSEHVGAVRSLADRLAPDTDHLVVLGIGGSALGPIALHAALNPATWNLLPREARGGPRLFVLDNVDPMLVGQALDEVRREDPALARTVFTVISKSGETAETAAQFMLVRSMLKSSLGPDYAKRMVAITDPRQGTMRAICEAEGYAALPVPEGVGGRFSVLSPVGLFSAAMCGIDIDALLDGAADMDQRCCDTDPKKNPAAILAWLLVELAARGKPNHVLMPYANALHPLADWFRQLWAESLGKRVDKDGNEVFSGFTPIRALGATDQHSQIQLYREGPNDKVIGFVVVESMEDDLEIPPGPDVDALRYLRGATLGGLLTAEKRATEYALVESRRPNFTISLPRLDAYHVGQFIRLWETTTAYAGLMLNVDAYDQPAVETGKVATFGLMGRAGYEPWKKKVDAALGDSPWTV